MNRKLFFPAVYLEETDQNGMARACAAIRVTSFLSPLLRGQEQRDDIDRTLHSRYLALLDGIAGWPENVNLALNIFTRPDLEYPLGGRLETALVITVTGRNGKMAIAETLGRHAALMSLAANLLPEVELAAITDEAELRTALRPFTPVTVRRIGRRYDDLVVAMPESGSGDDETGTIGFLAPAATAPRTTTEPESIPYLLPWSADTERREGLALLSEALLANPSPLWLQVRLRTTRSVAGAVDRIRTALHRCEKLLAIPGSSTLLTVQARALREVLTERLQQLNGNLFAAGIHLCSTAEMDEALVHSVAAVVTPRLSTPEESPIPLFGGFTISSISGQQFFAPDNAIEAEPFTTAEMAIIFRLPHPMQPGIPGLPLREYRTLLAAPELLRRSDGRHILVGDNLHQGLRNGIRLEPDERMHHCCILGQTGTGKSTLLANMIIQDIKADRGLCLIDPHGDLVAEVLRRYPGRRKDDLVLLDLTTAGHVLPFNLLAWREPAERDLIIDQFYTWFDREYDMRTTGGPMFELYFRSFLRTLMGDRPRRDFVPTMGDFFLMFSEPPFRRYCRRDIEDEAVLAIMDQAEEAGGDISMRNMAPYITSKLNRFVLDRNLRRMTGLEEMAIDCSEIMDHGKVMLVNLGRGQYGETLTSLLASQIVTRFKAAAMKRGSVPSEQRRDFFLYVDEFQHIASTDFVSLLSEARKYRMGLVLANQYAGQLETNGVSGRPSLLEAILGNVGAMIFFRLGIHDAELLEPLFSPDLTRHDLVNLPVGSCYARLRKDNDKPRTVSLRIRYRPTRHRPAHVADLVESSGRRYTIPAKEADKRIRHRAKRMRRLWQQ